MYYNLMTIGNFKIGHFAESLLQAYLYRVVITITHNFQVKQ